jgi:hypothetical protein
MFVDEHPPTSWKEWYTKNGAVKTASFIHQGSPYYAVYIKDSGVYLESFRYMAHSREDADSAARVLRDAYETTPSTYPTSD